MLRKDCLHHLYIFARQDSKVFHRKFLQNLYRSFRFVNVLMYSTATLKVCYVTTVLKQQSLPKYRTFFFPLLCSRTHCTNLSTIMASQYFKGHNDQYHGVTVDSNEEPCTPEEFTPRLTASLQQWIQNKRRVAWFRIYLPHSALIPILATKGFQFHHAKQEYVMLYRWLAKNEECNVPHYAHTNLGIGGFVYNEKTEEVLVVKEKYSHKTALWKLPGGYVEPGMSLYYNLPKSNGENLENAVIREVLEETGVQTTFKSIISFRHTHDSAFGCSDIYMVVYLSPLNRNIKKCEKEIADCRWMKISEYVEHKEVHAHNKMYAQKMLECIKHRVGVTVENTVHPTLNKPICVYSISKINGA